MTRPTGPWLLAGPHGATGVRQPPHAPGGPLPAAVLFDRDGTLVADVPYNGDPARVALMPGARKAVDAVRAAGIPVGVVTNQSGVARGLLRPRQVEDVRLRVEELLGPFAVWAVCPHGPGEGCGCRKPAPGLVLAACRRLAVPPERTVVIGDIGADMEAARGRGGPRCPGSHGRHPARGGHGGRRHGSGPDRGGTPRPRLGRAGGGVAMTPFRSRSRLPGPSSSASTAPETCSWPGPPCGP
ncbi:D-glycero-alpha-D-manno-heptose-1,7-bisphosphate 7-phosphatase [Streptomyces coeruleorubidus]|uniref:D-glycero-alpha-D-manno-heptose-1,7-bisphosphate 7-phosphatase n=1 Tax=Streptomyces coeruleorubidus TaxID=116188 RepID=UPI003CD04A6C